APVGTQPGAGADHDIAAGTATEAATDGAVIARCAEVAVGNGDRIGRHGTHRHRRRPGQRDQYRVSVACARVLVVAVAGKAGTTSCIAVHSSCSLSPDVEPGARSIRDTAVESSPASAGHHPGPVIAAGLIWINDGRDNACEPNRN